MIVKPWGSSLKLYDKYGYALYHLQIKKGGYSSVHRHSKSINKFVLTKGEVIVSILPIIDDFCTIVDFKLNLWDPLSIPAGVYHRFEAIDDSILYEIYTTDENEFDESDIDRFSSNGIKV